MWKDHKTLNRIPESISGCLINGSCKVQPYYVSIIMKGWTNDDRMMIACCNDGTRPVIFKIERIDIPENDEERVWLQKQNAAAEEYHRDFTVGVPGKSRCGTYQTDRLEKPGVTE